MKANIQIKIENYNDRRLDHETGRFVRREKECTHIVLLHLKEIRRRRLYHDLNFQTLHEYCVGRLGYTDGEAHYRISAMKLMQDSPKIERAIENGSLPLTNALIANNFISGKDRATSTREKENVVLKILGKSAREAREILKPKKTRKRKSIRPKLTVDNELLELLQELKSLSGKEELAILKEAVKLKIETIRKMRRVQASKPVAKVKKNIRYIPKSTEARVKLRAGDRCEHIDWKGQRCRQTLNLQLDHIHPFALGGDNGEDNLRILCREHNLRAAIKSFGADKMEDLLCRHKSDCKK